jgi:hypothetical protein
MPGASGCLIALALGAAVVEGGVGADTEVAAGRAPVDLDGPEENSIALTGTPAVGLRIHDETHTFTTTYAPRFYYRIPNPLEVRRPLVLHQIGLGYENLIDISTQWITNAHVNVGELDYTTASLVFDPQAAALQQDVAQVARVDGESTLRHSTSRRATLQLTLQGEYTTPINTPDAVVAPAPTEPPVDPTVVAPVAGEILKSASGTVRPELRYVLTRRDFLTTSLRVSYQWFSNGGRFVVISPQIGWERRLTPRTTFVSSAGPLYVFTLDAAPGNDDDNFIGGGGVLELRSILSRSDGAELTGHISGTVDWFFDPLAGTSDPRATLELGAAARFGRDWTFTPTASFSTLLREDSDGAAAVLERTDATVLRAELPVRYAITRAVQFNFGGRGSLRGTRLGSDDFRLNEQLEAWVYVGLSVAFATSGEPAPWLGL